MPPAPQQGAGPLHKGTPAAATTAVKGGSPSWEGLRQTKLGEYADYPRTSRTSKPPHPGCSIFPEKRRQSGENDPRIPTGW
jgi:hypothetical protein